MYLNNPNTNYRNLIAGVNNKVPLINGSFVTGINFDNAATTPPFLSVLEEVIKFAPWYSSVHRGEGYKSQLSTMLYEKARKDVCKFVNADTSYNTVIFVRNSTDAINKLSNVICNNKKNIYDTTNTKKCVILSSDMEHHSNDLPWRNSYDVEYISIDENGRLSLDDLKDKLEKYNDQVKLVSITGASNVTGYKNSIYEIASLVHEYGAKILVDGAQLVPHAPIDMKPVTCDEHIDFLVFSSHKMYSPFGIGVLIGPIDIFEEYDPDYVGGGTIDIVTHDFVTWNDVPEKHESGSPNVIGAVALSTAIKTLLQVGMKNIETLETKLTKYTLDNIKNIPNITFYSDTNNVLDRVSIIPFNIDGIPHNVTSKILSYEFGIAVRNGCFCAQPYAQKLLHISKEEMLEIVNNSNIPRPGMVRISFGLYNTFSEIDILLYALNKLCTNRDKYLKRYKDKNVNLLDI